MKTQTNTPAAAEPARVPTPTKDQEIAILRETIRQLGPLSYCGPWLAQQLDGIERDLRSDFFPQIDRDATIRDCAQMARVAEANAREIEAAGARVAKAKTDEAHAEACAIRGRILREIDKCRQTLGVEL